MTHLLSDEIARATARLAAAGIPSPRADAEELAAFVHGVKRAELHGVPDASFDARFWEGIARREAGEPLQHITGRAFFRYLELRVGPGVFVPRPETEVVAGWAIDTLRTMDVGDPLVVDLGTGSGAIALSIAQEVPRARVHAVEKDPRGLRPRHPQRRRAGRAWPRTPAPRRLRRRAARPRRHRRPGRQQPPLHPHVRVGVRRRRRPRLRPAARPCGAAATTVSTRSAWSSTRRGACCAPAAGPRSSTATSRATRSTGYSPKSTAGATCVTTRT